MLTYHIPILLSTILVSKLIVCQDLDLKISEQEELFRHLKSENETIENRRFQVIFPGTRWCGEGSIAKNEEELGFFNKADACCREHDQCSDIIMSGETKYEFTNNGPFTRLHCSCDEKFYDCLSSQCSTIAAAIGITYFDVLKSSCFTYDHPANCTETESDEIFGERCISYKVDEEKPKIWQWREAKKFDLSKTSKYFLQCFKDATLEKMKTTEKRISEFIYKYGIEPLTKLCNKLASDSWYRKYFCPENSANSNKLDNKTNIIDV